MKRALLAVVFVVAVVVAGQGGEGPDPPDVPVTPEDAGHGTAPDRSFSSTAYSCAPRGTPRIELVYARAQDSPDRFATYGEQIVYYAYAAINKVDRHSVARADLRAITPMRCTNKPKSRAIPAVHNVVVGLALADTTYRTITASLAAQGLNSTTAKYWIWFDGAPPGKAAGHGQCVCAEDDSSAGPDNLNNVGPDYAYVWGPPGGGGTMLHEATHAWGGVQNDSPNASGAHHCNDENDVLCYDDSGPGTPTLVCDTTSSVYDCNGDDYFHPAPPPGSYLATHWNIAGCYNRFLRVAGCGPPPPS